MTSAGDVQLAGKERCHSRAVAARTRARLRGARPALDGRRSVRSRPWFAVLVACVTAGVVIGGLYWLTPRRPPALQTAEAAAPAPRPRPASGAGPERAGYYRTAWPSEHADLWRSHAAPGAGLPAGFDPAEIQVTEVSLNVPTWGYTRDRDEVFVLGGSPFALDTFTQSIVSGESRAGWRQVAHDLADRSTPYVARIDPRTMAAVTVDLDRGRTVNYTGGLVMHGNGYVYAVSRSVLFKINPDSMQVEASVGLPLTGRVWAQQYWTTYNGLQVLESGRIVTKGFNLADADASGYLLQIDPDALDLDVVHDAVVSSARLTVDQDPEGPDFLYHVDATESVRYEILESGFRLDEAWTRPYREQGDGSTQGSSPLVFGDVGQVVFADNTAPGASTPIRLFSRDATTPSAGPARSVPAFRGAGPGFNFFMVAGDPFDRQLVVSYDPMNGLVSAHRLGGDGGLQRVWELDAYRPSASPAIVPDRDLLYIDDYRDGRDHLVVLQLSTGRELASVPLSATLPTIGGILPGPGRDVFVVSSETGTDGGLVSRVFVP
jgi:hypothetical protein